LFQTTARLLRDLAHDAPGYPVLIAQFGTRAYKKRTIIGFDSGPRVVEIDCAENGPRDPERLYILDLEERQKSFFWARF